MNSKGKKQKHNIGQITTLWGKIGIGGKLLVHYWSSVYVDDPDLRLILIHGNSRPLQEGWQPPSPAFLKSFWGKASAVLGNCRIPQFKKPLLWLMLYYCSFQGFVLSPWHYIYHTVVLIMTQRTEVSQWLKKKNKHLNNRKLADCTPRPYWWEFPCKPHRRRKATSVWSFQEWGCDLWLTQHDSGIFNAQKLLRGKSFHVHCYQLGSQVYQLNPGNFTLCSFMEFFLSLFLLCGTLYLATKDNWRFL